MEALLATPGVRLIEVDHLGRTALHRALERRHLPVLTLLYRATRLCLSEDLAALVREYITPGTSAGT